MGTYTAERQREQPYLAQVKGPLFEQWYLLHHRLVRVITDCKVLTDHIRHFLYYAELLAECTYDDPSLLPTDIPIDLFWQAGQRLYRPVALTCYLFETGPCESFPPAPAQPKPEAIEWNEISGVDGPMRGKWKHDELRFREYQLCPGVNSRISSVLHKSDLHATVFIEEVDKCQSWFIMRFVFYMLIGAMLGYDGYEVIHAGAVAIDDSGVLLIGSPGSGKSTLVLSCLQEGMTLLADDVLFLAKDDDIVRIYAFPEDIGVRQGAFELLSDSAFIQTVTDDERQKYFVDVQRHFNTQVTSSASLRLMLFMDAEHRDDEFRIEPLSTAHAVSTMMQEYVSNEKAQAGEAAYMFDVFSDMAIQAPAYHLWLSPDVHENARQVRALLEQHAKKSEG